MRGALRTFSAAVGVDRKDQYAFAHGMRDVCHNAEGVEGVDRHGGVNAQFLASLWSCRSFGGQAVGKHLGVAWPWVLDTLAKQCCKAARRSEGLLF